MIIRGDARHADPLEEITETTEVAVLIGEEVVAVGGEALEEGISLTQHDGAVGLRVLDGTNGRAANGASARAALLLTCDGVRQAGGRG